MHRQQISGKRKPQILLEGHIPLCRYFLIYIAYIANI